MRLPTWQAKERLVTVPIAPLSGLRDLAPPLAAERRSLARSIHDVFEARGYELATLSLIEREEVLLRGLAETERADLLKFVDPASGEIAVLRPDITPQIARLVATELSHIQPPHRICYHGTVFRSRSTRARTHRQLAQAGVECLGIPGPEGDQEIIELALETLERLGLEFTIELRCPRLLDHVLREIPAALRGETELALQRKDGTALESLLRRSPLEKPQQLAVLDLVTLYGPAEDTLASFSPNALGTPAVSHAKELQELCTRILQVDRKGSAPNLSVDLAATRGRRYYSGVSFQILAKGPGEPVGRGGRYDDLVGRYGAPMPATGFALMLDPLAWALRETGKKTGSIWNAAPEGNA